MAFNRIALDAINCKITVICTMSILFNILIPKGSNCFIMASDNKKLAKEEKTPQKKCFIITPIGDENSETRRKAEGLIVAIIKPVLISLGYDPIIPHKMTLPGSITDQVIECILNADMVIANLSGLNPNVMYELAVRHAARKPVVCVVEETTNLPFDIKQDRVIIYNDEFYRVESMKRDLSQMIESAANLKTENIDNPIYRAQSNSIIEKQLNKTSNTNDVDINRVILNRLSRIEDLIYNNSRKSTSKQTNHIEFSIKYDNPLNQEPSQITAAVREKLNSLRLPSRVFVLDENVIKLSILASPDIFDDIVHEMSSYLSLDLGLTNLEFML